MPATCAHAGCQTPVYMSDRHPDYDTNAPTDVFCGVHCPLADCAIPAHKSIKDAVAAAGGGGGGGGGGPIGAPAPAPAPAPAQQTVTVVIDYAKIPGVDRLLDSKKDKDGSVDLNDPKTWYMSASQFATFSHKFDSARVRELWRVIGGASLEDLRRRKEVRDQVKEIKAGAITDAAAAAMSKDVTLELQAEVFKDTPLATVVLGASIAAHTPATTRRATGALLGTMRALASRDADLPLEDQITIPTSRLRAGAEGQTAAYKALSENLVHLFESKGREWFLALARRLVVKYSKDAHRFVVRDPKTGILSTCCFVTHVVRILFVSEKAWLVTRKVSWAPEVVSTMMQGPHEPVPLIDKPVTTIGNALLRRWVTAGGLVETSVSDPDGEVLGEALESETAFWEGYFEAWREKFVMTTAMSNLLKQVPDHGASATNAGNAATGTATAAAGGAGGPGRGRRGGRGRGNGKTGGRGNNGNPGGGPANGNPANPAPAAAAAGDAGTAGAPKRQREGDTRDDGPARKFRGTTAVFDKCHWVGPDGASCTRVPPEGRKSTQALCATHVAAYNKMTDADRAATVTKLRANGVPIAT